MFSKRNILLSWCLSLVSCVPITLSYDLPYRSVSEKTVGGYRTTESTSFAIPSDQCSGFIDESLICGAGGVAGAVRVEVQERMSFPSVRVDRHLRNVTIIRAVDSRRRCPGRALVLLRVGCLVGPAPPPTPPPARRKRELPPVGRYNHLTTI